MTMASRRRAVVALLVAAVVVVVFLIAFGGGHTTIVHADFRNAGQLRSGDPVRVDGVQVGTVGAIHLHAHAGTVTADLRITNRHVQVTSSARAQLRWGTLLGGSLYVALSPGTPSFARDRVDHIPISQTASQVEFDDLLQVFDNSTPANLRHLLHGTATGLSDPAGLHRLLRSLPPTLPKITRGVDPLTGTQSDDLRSLVASTGKTLHGLSVDQARLAGLVSGAATTLTATAESQQSLRRFIDLTPPAAVQLRQTTQRLPSTLDKVDGVSDSLRAPAKRLVPTLDRLDPTLDVASSVLRSARPLLRDLSPALASLDTASRAGLPLISSLTPTLKRANDELLPWLNRVDPDTQRTTAEMIGPTANAAAAAGSEYDYEGYVLRFAPSGGEAPLLTAPCITHFTDPTATEKVQCDALEKTLGEIFGGTP